MNRRLPPTAVASSDAALELEATERFAALVESVGVKRFALALGLSTRQVNRILSGSQPNPLERTIRCLQSASPEAGDAALDFLCREMGGHFVREEGVESAIIHAVRESAEAIAAISDGDVSEKDEAEIRDAVAALIGLVRTVRESRRP